MSPKGIHIRGRLGIVIGQNIITVIILPLLYILILTEIFISIMKETSGNEKSHILMGCSTEMAAL
jgi:hypothetical protein